MVTKEVVETTATQTLGGPLLSSRGSVAVYTPQTCPLLCLGVFVTLSIQLQLSCKVFTCWYLKYRLVYN